MLFRPYIHHILLLLLLLHWLLYFECFFCYTFPLLLLFLSFIYMFRKTYHLVFPNFFESLLGGKLF